VDLLNNNNHAVTLGGVGLAHQEFSGNCVPKDTYTVYWEGTGDDTLLPGQIVRVHTGRHRDLAAMLQEDWKGAHLHAFAERDWFVLNNQCGDVISLWSKDSQGQWAILEDKARYSKNPREGAILTRSGDMLV
jgi:hypothetical protein